jgi:hypothetical protein
MKAIADFLGKVDNYGADPVAFVILCALFIGLVGYYIGLSVKNRSFKIGGQIMFKRFF